MRILIVNAYKPSEFGYQRFSQFQYHIMKCLANQKELIDTENEYFIRDKDSIDDFLFEIETSHVKTDAANKFDQLDLIFLAGDPTIKPWDNSMRKILSLLRMAFRVSKLVFTSAFATFALIYLSASNIDGNIRIINGNNGGRLSDIKKLQKKIEIKQNDFFLDHTSGDLYSFNYESSEWMPKTNVGLHFRKAAQEFQSIGKYILKAPVYKPKENILGGQTLHKNKNNETITSIKKVYYHHWAFQGMENKFLVPLQNNWDIHTFSFTSKDKQFVVLAESDEGPSILEFKCFLSSVFEIDQKYGETLKLINNFILNALRQIKNPQQINSLPMNVDQIQQSAKTYNQSSLNDMLHKSNNEKIRHTLQLMELRKSKMGISEVDFEEDNQGYGQSHIRRSVHHVGFTLNRKYLPDVVKSNSVQDKKFKVQQTLSKKKSIKDDNDESSRYEIPSNLLGQSMIFSQQLEVINNKENQESSRKSMHIKTLSQGDVRQILHPQISEQCLNFKDLWQIPGNLSSKNAISNEGMKIKRKVYQFKSRTITSTSQSRKQSTHQNEPYLLNNQNKMKMKMKTQKNEDITTIEKALKSSVLFQKSQAKNLREYLLRPDKKIKKESSLSGSPLLLKDEVDK